MNDEPERFIELCQVLVKRGIHLPRKSQLYFKIEEKLNEEMIKWAKRIGLDYIYVGIESGSKKLRKQVSKKFSERAMFETIEKTLAQGMVPLTSFMIGIPGENWSTVFETFHLMTQLSKMGCVEQVFGFKPYPGTWFFDNPSYSDFSIVEKNFDYWTDEYMVVRTSALSEAQLASITWVMRYIHGWFKNKPGRKGGRAYTLNLVPQMVWDIVFYAGIQFHMLARAILGLKRSKIYLRSRQYYPRHISWGSFMKDKL